MEPRSLGSDRRRKRKGAIRSPAKHGKQPLDSKLKKCIKGGLIIPPRVSLLPIPVDPAGGHCYWNPIKTCESRDFGSRRTAQ